MKYYSNRIAFLFWVVVLLIASCDPFDTKIEEDANSKTAIYYESKIIKEPLSKDTLNVVCWNIKFGGGRIDFFFDCYGDRVLMTESEVVSNMNGIGKEIKHLDPDILLLQEVDIQSKRSAYVDQLQWILDHTDLNYAYYASQWKSDYVPSDGLGRVNSGNAILSKYPLKNAKRIDLPLIEEQSGIVQYFYLRRNILKTLVTVKGKEVYVFNTHTSAYSTDDTRQKQLSIIGSEVDLINDTNGTFILGGDFNTIPPGSVKYEEFNDDACKGDPDYEAASFKEELDLMLPFYMYEPAVSLERYAGDNSAFYSFTSDKNGFWNRKLDYLFTNGDFVDDAGLVHQSTDLGGAETMPLSDHAPLSAMYILK